MNESKYREPKNNPPLSLSKKEYENIKSFPIIKFYLNKRKKSKITKNRK